MSKIVYNAARDVHFEQGGIVDQHIEACESNEKLEQFHLSVVRPIKGKPGELVYEMTVVDRNVSAAVAYVKHLVGKDSGLLVLQTASVIRDKVVNPEQREALLKRLGLYEPEGYDLPGAIVKAQDEGLIA